MVFNVSFSKLYQSSYDASLDLDLVKIIFNSFGFSKGEGFSKNKINKLLEDQDYVFSNEVIPSIETINKNKDPSYGWVNLNQVRVCKNAKDVLKIRTNNGIIYLTSSLPELWDGSLKFYQSDDLIKKAEPVNIKSRITNMMPSDIQMIKRYLSQEDIPENYKHDGHFDLTNESNFPSSKFVNQNFFVGEISGVPYIVKYNSYMFGKWSGSISRMWGAENGKLAYAEMVLNLRRDFFLKSIDNERYNNLIEKGKEILIPDSQTN